MKLTPILLAPLLIVSLSSAKMSADVTQQKGTKGDTAGKYAKPGAPIEMHYQASHAKVYANSDVQITLTTAQTAGEMVVDVTLDEHLTLVSGETGSRTFTLSPTKGEHIIGLQVSSAEDGLYYIRLMTSIKGKGMRAFAVPISIGNGKLKMKKANIQKTSNGENITVFKAVETIR